MLKHSGFAKELFPGERNASCQGVTRLFHLLMSRRWPATLLISRTPGNSSYPSGGLPTAAQGRVPTEAGSSEQGRGERGLGEQPRSSLHPRRQPLLTRCQGLGRWGSRRGPCPEPHLSGPHTGSAPKRY